jgi:hypothetical protein
VNEWFKFSSACITPVQPFRRVGATICWPGGAGARFAIVPDCATFI